MLIPKGPILYHSEAPFPQPSQSPSPGGSLFPFCSEQPSLGSDAEGRRWVCTFSILADFPGALHGFCTMPASNQRLTLIPRLNNYQCLPTRWVKKLNPFLNLYFPVCQWGFHVYTEHLYYSCSSELPVFALGSSLTCTMFWCNQDSKLLCFLDKYFVWLSVLCRILC